MSDKRFILAYEKGNEAIFEDNNHIFPKRMTNKEVEKMLNSLNEENKQLKTEVEHWKHRVSSLLFILSQFDNEKVKKLLEELDERETI